MKTKMRRIKFKQQQNKIKYKANTKVTNEFEDDEDEDGRVGGCGFEINQFDGEEV